MLLNLFVSVTIGYESLRVLDAGDARYTNFGTRQGRPIRDKFISSYRYRRSTQSVSIRDRSFMPRRALVYGCGSKSPDLKISHDRGILM